MKALLIGFIAIFVSTASCSCSGIPVKPWPEHVGVDFRLRKLVKEFKWLSAQRGITFTDTVTIGFKKIKAQDVVGICTYAPGWREIDIDIDYWNNSNDSKRMALVFHELTHCYCTRAHDYAEGELYPDTLTERIARALQWKIEGGPRPGYFDDGCPTSLMYPVVVDTDCFRSHYQEYVDEMLNRCDPW